MVLVFGFIGLILVIIGYMNEKRLELLYLLSTLGSLFLIVHSIIIKDIPFFLLQGICATITFVKFIEYLKIKRRENNV